MTNNILVSPAKTGRYHGGRRGVNIWASSFSFAQKKGIPPKLAKNMLTGKMVINHIILVYRCLQITQVGHYSHGSANTMRNHEIGAFVTINYGYPLVN